MRDDEAPADKAEFVALMVELSRRDKVKYREVVATGWAFVYAAMLLLEKSVFPN